MIKEEIERLNCQHEELVQQQGPELANKPIPEELFYEQKIDVGSEQDGIITPSGENRTHTGSFDATLITDLNGEKRNYLGTFDTTLVTDLLGEQRNYIGYITSSKTCLLYTSPSPRDATLSRMPSSA